MAEWFELRIFCPLADDVLGSPEFTFSATLINSQLIFLLPVGIVNLVMFMNIHLSLSVYIDPEKPRWGVAN